MTSQCSISPDWVQYLLTKKAPHDEFILNYLSLRYSPQIENTVIKRCSVQVVLNSFSLTGNLAPSKRV